MNMITIRLNKIVLTPCLFLFFGANLIAQQPQSSEKRESAAKLPPSMFVCRSLEECEQELGMTSKSTSRFYLLTKLPPLALTEGKTDKAKSYALELLNQAPYHIRNWNYGNAIHVGNLVLGRIALASGDVEEAKRYLLEAGKTPGSAQLNSFGPNMLLAKELLERGEREVVIEYFDLCSKFWLVKFSKLEEWKEIVKNGQVPRFGANLLYLWS